LHNGFNPKDAPDHPEGWTPELQAKHWFAKTRNWHPRQVDELTLDELEWLPIMEQATQDAVEQLRDK
jgi:hypothetical protein